MGQSQSHPPRSATLPHAGRSNATLDPSFTSNLPPPEVDLTSSTPGQSNSNADSSTPPPTNVGGRRRVLSTLLRKKRPNSMMVSTSLGGVDRPSNPATGSSEFGHSNLNQRPPASSSSTVPTPTTPVRSTSVPVSPAVVTTFREESGGSKPDVSSSSVLEGQPIPRRGFKGKSLSNLLNRRSWAGHTRNVVPAASPASVMSSSKSPTARSSNIIPPNHGSGRFDTEPHQSIPATITEHKIEDPASKGLSDKVSHGDNRKDKDIQASDVNPSAVLSSATAQPGLASGSGSNSLGPVAIKRSSGVGMEDRNRSEPCPLPSPPSVAPETTNTASKGKIASVDRGAQDAPVGLESANSPSSAGNLPSTSPGTAIKSGSSTAFNLKGPLPGDIGHASSSNQLQEPTSSISAARRKIAMLSGTQAVEESALDSTSTSPVSSSSEPLEQDPAFMDSPPSSTGLDVQQETLLAEVLSESPDCSLSFHDASAELNDEEPREDPAESPYSLRNLVQQIRRVLENIESNMADERIDPGSSDDSQPESDTASVPMDVLPFLPPASPSDLAVDTAMSTRASGSNITPAVGSAAIPTSPRPLERNGSQSNAALIPSSSPTVPTLRVPSLPIIPAGTTMIVQGVVQTADGPPPSYTPPSSSSNSRQAVVRTLEPISSSGPSSRRLSENTRRERPRSFLSRARAHSMFSNSHPTTADELARLGDSPEPARLSEDDGSRTPEPPASGAPAPALRTSSDNPSGAAELLGALLIAAASATANMLLSEPPDGSNNGTQQTTQPTQTTAPNETTPLSPIMHDDAQTSPSLDPNGALSRMIDEQSAEYLTRIRRNLLRHRARPRSRSSPRETENGEPSPPTPPTDLASTSEASIQQPIGSERRRSSVARERPRSIMNNLRDRWFGNGRNGWDDDVDEDSLFWPPGQQTESIPNRNTRAGARTGGAEDAIEALRERIASELMRALARENPDSANGGPTPLASGSASLSSANTPSGPGIYPRPISSDSSPSFIPYPPPLPSGPLSSPPNPLESILGLGRSLAAPPAQSAGSNIPAEGSFDRFLHDTSVDLRNTLVERMQRRHQALTASLPLPNPDPNPLSSSSGRQTANTENDGTEISNQSSSGAANGPQAVVSQVVNRPQDGIIEPRLNWWRMHQFPARTVQNPPSASDDPNTLPMAPQNSSSSPTAAELANNADPSDASSLPSNISTLIPVIVVGIRTAPTILVQDIAALTSPPATTTPIPRSHRTTNRLPRPLSSRARGSSPVASGPSTTEQTAEASTSSPPSGSAGSTSHHPSERSRTLRTWSSRFTRAFSRGSSSHVESPTSRGERSSQELPEASTSETTELPAVGSSGLPQTQPEEVPEATTTGETPENTTAAPRDRTRNYLIWVIGGYYPPNHPILVSPNLLLNHFDHEDLWGLADLLGQVKPPVASRSDIDEAGLEVIKGALLSKYERDGRVKSNTADRCAICLGDYEAEEDLRILSCQHVFHRDCVDKWLEEGRNNCPACRTKGVPTQEASATTA